MLRLNDGSKSPGLRSTCLALLSMSIVGCALIGVEPDEIDLAMGSESDEAGDATGGSGLSEESADSANTGPDDTTTAADTTTGDGDGDSSGDGDGDGGDGDGDGDEVPEPCDEFGSTELVLGSNDVMIAAGAGVLEGSCGYGGPEQVYSYTSDAAGNLEFTFMGDFDAALYAVDGLICLPLTELDCVDTPDVLMVAVEVGQTIYVVVDAATPDGGTGTLDVAFAP